MILTNLLQLYKKSIAWLEIFAEFNSRTTEDGVGGGGGVGATPRLFKKIYREDFVWVLAHLSNCSFIFDTHSRCEFGEIGSCIKEKLYGQ